MKKNLRAEDIERNTSKIMQLKEGKKINNQLKEWTRKLREPCRGVAGDVGEEEGRGRTVEGEEEDGRAGGQQGIGVMALPSPPSTEEKSQFNQATPSSIFPSSSPPPHYSTSTKPHPSD